MTTATGHLLRDVRVSIARREKVVVGVLVLSALVVRLLLIVYFETDEFISQWMMNSEVGLLAQSLVSGQGFAFDGQSSVWRGPLYPFILSLIFRVFGSFSVASAAATLILLSIVSALTIIPMYCIGKRSFGHEVGMIAGLLWVFHPGSLRYSAWIASESSFIALGVVLTIWLFLKLQTSRLWTRDSFLCGLVVALTLLTRPVMLVFVPFAILWLWGNSGTDRKRALCQIVVVLTTIAATLAPWTARNYTIFHQFIPITGTFGLNLWQGNNPYIPTQDGVWTLHVGRPLETLAEHLSQEEVAYLNSLNEVELSNILLEKAVEFISSHPGQFIGNTLQRVYLFWTIPGRAGSGRIPQWGGVIPVMLSVFHWGTVALTGWGILLSLWRWRETGLLLLLLLTFPIPHYLTIVEEYRYRFPLEGVILLFVAASVSYLLHLANIASKANLMMAKVER